MERFRQPPLSRHDLKYKGLLTVCLVVAQRHGCRLEDLLGRRRWRNTMRARHELCAVLHASARFSYPEIGLIVGRDHTTCIASVRRYAATHGRVDPALVALVANAPAPMFIAPAKLPEIPDLVCS